MEKWIECSECRYSNSLEKTRYYLKEDGSKIEVCSREGGEYQIEILKKNTIAYSGPPDHEGVMKLEVILGEGPKVRKMRPWYCKECHSVYQLDSKIDKMVCKKCECSKLITLDRMVGKTCPICMKGVLDVVNANIND